MTRRQKDFFCVAIHNVGIFWGKNFWQVFLGSLILVGILLGAKKRGRFAV